MSASHTYHDPNDDEEDMEERLQGAQTVFAPSVTLHATPIHSHVPVRQLLEKLYKSRRNGVQTVRCNSINIV